MMNIQGAGMRDTDSDADEPDSQRGEAMVGIASPGGTVVHGHAFRQAVTAKDVGEPVLDGVGLLIGASQQAEAKRE
jgi:hypothetical protein